MWRSTFPLVLLVILATAVSAKEVSQASINDDTKAILKNWFYDLALEDLIELRTESEDSMKVVHLDPSEEYPHPSIGALLDKSHPTYPVEDHCEAAQNGGEMRMMLQLIPKELICREIKIPKSNPNEYEYEYYGGQFEVDTENRSEDHTEEAADVDEEASRTIEHLDSSTAGSTSKENVNKEGLVSLKYVTIEGLPKEGFPTESIISMTKVGVDSDEHKILIAILFPKSLWMVSMESSAEGTKYKYVDHLSWDKKTEAVTMNILPIYMMNVLPIFQTIDNNTIGSWENHILVHHKVSDDKTVDLPSLLMKTEISLIKVETNGKLLQFFNSFQAELPPSVVQASLSFTKDKSSYVVYATAENIAGYRVKQSSQVSQLIVAKNLDTSIEIGEVVDMILVENMSNLFLVVLEVTGESARIKVFPWIEEPTQEYNLNEIPVFEAEHLGKVLKIKFLKGSPKDYIILIGSDPGSKTVLYEITEQGQLIHKQDFLIDEIVDVHLVQLHQPSNDFYLIFIQKIGVVVYSLESLTWKIHRQLDYENSVLVSTMPGSTTTFSNPKSAFGLLIGKTSSPSSLLELSLRSNDGLTNQKGDSMSSSQTTISTEETTTIRDPNFFLQPFASINNSSTHNQDTTEDPTLADSNKQKGSDQEKVLIELIRLLKFYVFISRDETKNESTSGLKPLIELLNDVKDNEELKQPDYAKSVEYVIADLEKYQDNKKLKWHPDNVKKLDLVLNLVADIVNHVDRTPMTLEALIQLLRQFHVNDQFRQEREIIEYVIECLKEQNQGIKSKLERKQNDLVLLRVSFLVDGRNIESFNKKDLRDILNTIKLLTKYDDGELEGAFELLSLITVSSLNAHQKDSIRKALDEENKKAVVDMSHLEEIIAKLEKVRVDNVIAKNADPVVEKSTQLNAANEDNEDEIEEYDYDGPTDEVINTDEFDDDEDEEDALKDLEGYIQELGSLEAQDARYGSEVDWCFRGNNCHTMADCQNGEFNYICRCKNGFQGDGIHCESVNEDLELNTNKHEHDAQPQVSTQNEQEQETITEEQELTTSEPQPEHEISSTQKQAITQSKQETVNEDSETITREPHHQHDEVSSTQKQGITQNKQETVNEEEESTQRVQVTTQDRDEQAQKQDRDEQAQQQELNYLAELISNFRSDIEKMELEAESKDGEQMSTENAEDIFNQHEEETTEEQGKGQDMISSQREELNSLTELISTLKIYVDRKELEANSKDKKQDEELVLSPAQREELRSLTELINRFRIYVEKRELQAASQDKGRIATESYQTATVKALIGNDHFLKFNSSEKHFGLWPLIEHLRALSLHQVFQNSHYAKNVEKLIDELKLADAHFANAEWDAKKLDAVLDKERELIMGSKTDKIVIQKDASSKKNTVKHMQEEKDASSESLQEESEKGKLQWLIESFNSNSLVALPYRSSILSKINEANEMKNVDVKLLKEILSDLENAKRTLLGSEKLPSQRNSPESEDLCSRGNNCHQNADCHNGKFGFTCHCKNGFQGNGTHCDAIDDVSRPATSDSLTGSSTEHSSTDITEDDVEDSAATELDTGSSTENAVNSTEGSESAITGSSTENSVNWCSQENNCHEMADCQNNLENYTCHCKDGFQGNGTNCDECDQIGDTYLYNCSLINKQCVYTLGNFHCSCVPGFLWDTTSNSCVIPPSPNSAHESEDWCSRGNNCHLMADCKNSELNYSCHCKNGYQGNGSHCDAINEVLESTTSDSQTGSSTENSAKSTEGSIEDEVTAANLAANDTATNDTGMSGLKEMIYDWREKFYIILAFFLLFTILFLIIIVILIYKVNKAKDAYQSVVNVSQ